MRLRITSWMYHFLVLGLVKTFFNLSFMTDAIINLHYKQISGHVSVDISRMT